MLITLMGHVADLVQAAAEAMGMSPQEVVERLLEERLTIISRAANSSPAFDETDPCETESKRRK